MFEYPLRPEELYAHQGLGISEDAFHQMLEDMVDKKLLSKKEGFYFSPFARHENIVRRKKGNVNALEMMPTAIKWGKRIFRFPFVRSVSLSGSLSKNYFDEHSDIDFFVVTKSGRLWICRTLLILYWKSLSLKNKKYFCTNYFIDETVLEMEEKNHFTATELSYLVPLINAAGFNNLMTHNTWVKSYINNRAPVLSYTINVQPGIVKKAIEALLQNPIGDMLDNFLLKKTIERWRRKYPELAAEDFELQFRSRKNVCKRHTKGFQNKVLQQLETLRADYETRTGVKLS